MDSKIKKEIKEVKDNILNSTRILDKKQLFTDKERWYVIDILIKSDKLIDILKKEINKNGKEDWEIVW